MTPSARTKQPRKGLFCCGGEERANCLARGRDSKGVGDAEGRRAGVAERDRIPPQWINTSTGVLFRALYVCDARQMAICNLRSRRCYRPGNRRGKAMLQTDARESARLAFTQRQKFVAGYDKSGNAFGDALGTSTARIVEMETGRRRHMIAPDGHRRWNRAGWARDDQRLSLVNATTRRWKNRAQLSSANKRAPNPVS